MGEAGREGERGEARKIEAKEKNRMVVRDR
jgi:hypothetical protein